MEGIAQLIKLLPADTVNVYIALLRIVAPLLMILLLWRCGKPLLSFKAEPEVWAVLQEDDKTKTNVEHWENVIGRSKKCDIIVDIPTVSRNHAVLTRYDDGSWTIADAGSKAGVLVNGKKVQIAALKKDDVINLCGLEMKLKPITQKEEVKLAQKRPKAAGFLDSAANLGLLTILQFLSCLAYLLNGDPAGAQSVLQGFGGIMLAQWVLLVIYAMIRRTSFEVETIAFFLCTMGMNVIAATKPMEAQKQLIAMSIGIFAFLAIGWSLRDLERAKFVRHLATVAGIGFLVVTLLFGTEYYGAKNWLVIGGTSMQLSELSKVCFVFVAASTMDRIMQRRNLIVFIVYSALMCCLLAAMNDFGTALVFFVAFLAVAYMRSGSLGTIALAIAALIFAGIIVANLAPHVLRRFAIWGHIWEDPLGQGYQQVRSLMCLASGGLLGLGAGNGWMKGLPACDTDIVFATLGEEWGLIAACCMVLMVVVLALFCLRSARMGRSCFYTIGACTAATILLAQTILNVMGTVDLLPFTGVTFPFVSNGGSSMIGTWGLLAFVKAADTRQNASFAVRMNSGKGVKK